MSQQRLGLICIAGPIGAGKSTLVGPLAAALGARAYREQIDANPVYVAALEAPDRWAFESELTFLVECLENWACARRADSTAVLERCAADNAAVFAAARAAHGEISAHQFELLNRFAAVAPALGGVPDLVVMLSCSARVCAERVHGRNKPAERRYTEAYLQEIGDRYEAWLETWTHSPVVRLDSEANDIRSPAVVEALAADVRTALEAQAA